MWLVCQTTSNVLQEEMPAKKPCWELAAVMTIENKTKITVGKPACRTERVTQYFYLKTIIYSYLNFFHNILKAKGQWLEIFDTYLLLKTLPWWTGYFGVREDISKGKIHNMYIRIVKRLRGHKILAFFLLQIVKTFLKKKYYSVNFFVWISARNLKICLWCWLLFL